MVRRRWHADQADSLVTDSQMTDMRSGFVAIVGRPNAGKSTLVNALVGAKIAITSDKPQTTRRVLRGIVNGPGYQLVLVDTPGVHRPRTLLGERLNASVAEALSGVDVVAVCLPANEPLGPGDRRVIDSAFERRGPVVAVLTKTDTVDAGQVVARLDEIGRIATPRPWAHIVPVCAPAGANCATLTDVLVSELPPGPALFPTDLAVDEPVDITIAELIREAALDGVREELPHSIAVVVDEVIPREDSERELTDVFASIYVERDSQKAIIIGKGGSRLRTIGTLARRGIEGVLGTPVFLDLRVKVARDWQRDPKQLRRLGL